MFQAVRELSVAAFCQAPSQEKLMREWVRVERILGTMGSLIKTNIVFFVIFIFLLVGMRIY